MAIVKTLIVKGVARFLTDAYMSTIRSGIWNGSTIQVGYGGTGVTSAKGDTETPVFLASNGITPCSYKIPHATKAFKINGVTFDVFTNSTGTAPTIFAPTALAGTGGYVLATNSDKTGLEWVANLDHFVTQSESTTANYRGITLGYTNVAGTEDSLTTSVTNQVYVTNKLRVLPSTGSIISKGGAAFADNIKFTGAKGITSSSISDSDGYLLLYYNSGNILGAFGNGTTTDIPTYVRSTGNNLYHKRGNTNSSHDYLIADAGNIVNDNINVDWNTETTIATIAGIPVKVKVPTPSRRAFYGTCDTAADTATKVVTLSNDVGWELVAGTVIGVKFTNSNTASDVELQVNSETAASIFYNNAVYTGTDAHICGNAGKLTYYMYDGTNWAWLGSGYIINTTYSTLDLTTLTTGTETTSKLITAKVLNDWLHTKLHTVTNTWTYSTDTFGNALIVERGGSTNSAAIQFKNSNGTLGYVGMTGAVDGGLKRWKGDTTAAYLIADAGNISNIGATIGTSLTTIATIAGIDITAKISSSTFDERYVKLSDTELTIESTISSYQKGIVEFYRSSGNHIAFIQFANKDDSGNKQVLGAIGFHSGNPGLLEYRDTTASTTKYYAIAHSGNITNNNITIPWNTETTLATIAGISIKAKIPAIAPSISAGTTNTNKIIITVGGEDSSEFTIPYASNAGKLSNYTIDLLFKKSGENLIKGTTFASITGWAEVGWNGGKATYDSTNGIYKMWSTNGWHSIYYTLDSQYALKKVAFSFDIMFVSAESTEDLRNVLIGSANAYISNGNNYKPSTSDQWEHKTGTITLGSTPYFTIMILGTDSQNKTCTYLIRNLKVELGEMQSCWTPAHADIRLNFDDRYVTSVAVTDDTTNHPNLIRYVKNGTSNYFTVPYATNAKTSLLLKPIATTTTVATSTLDIPSGSKQVWGEKFTDSTLKYTPSGGSETTITDSGDWVMWLTPSATSNTATLNMKIDGTYYGAFRGNVTGNLNGIVRHALTGGTYTAASNSGSGNNRYKPAKWNFNAGITPASGDMVTIKLPGAGHDYGVFLSTNNGTNYYPVLITNSERFVTHFPSGAFITLVFDATASTNSMYALAGGTSRVTVNGGAWRVLTNYNDGNNYHAISTTASNTASKWATASWFVLRQYCTFTLYLQNANTVQGAITLNVNGTGAKPVYINGSASSSSNYTLPAGSYFVYYNGTNYYLRTDAYIPISITGTANRLKIYTETTNNSKPYRIIGQQTLSSGWLNKGLVLAVASRHSGIGIYSIHYGAEVSNGYYALQGSSTPDTYFTFNNTYCQIRYFGTTDNMSNTHIICHIKPASGTNPTSAVFTFFLHSGDGSNPRISILQDWGTPFTLIENGATMSTIDTNTYGERKASTVVNQSSSCTGNSATATKWQTASTLTIGNKGKSVDGSANVSWSLSDIGAVAKAGDTMTGPLNFSNSNTVNTTTPGINFGNWARIGANSQTLDLYSTSAIALRPSQTITNNSYSYTSGLVINSTTLEYNSNLVAHAGNISNNDATIGTSSTTIATIAGVDITAKVNLSNLATPIKVTKTLNVDSWENVSAFTGTGTYAIQISSGNLYASGILSGCGGNDTAIEEVPLHVANKDANTPAGDWRPYVRINGGQMQMTTNEASPGTERTYTIKILKLI